MFYNKQLVKEKTFCDLVNFDGAARSPTSY